MPPRPNSTDEEILAITIELIAEYDVSGVSVDVIAEKAGVSKATIYRRWPTRDALILEAYKHFLKRPGADPDTGSLRKDLILLLEELVDFFNRPNGGKVFGAFLNAAVRNPELAVLSQRITKEARSAYKKVIDRAIKRGDLSTNVDVKLMIDFTISPFLYQGLTEHKVLRKKDVRPIVDATLAAFS